MSIIVAVEMSSQPFKSFQFDGILGLGLPGLTMSRTVWTVLQLATRQMRAFLEFVEFVLVGSMCISCSL